MLKEKLSKSLKYKFGEILLVFAVGLSFILILKPLFKDDPIKSMAVVWTANVIMLVMVWVGMKIRGESWDHFGLILKPQGWRKILKTFLWSLFVFVLAIFGFAIASSIMASLLETTGDADMTGYNYMKGNLPLFLLSVFGVLIVSSFGEEVIYRAFLINRINEMGVDDQLIRSAIVISSIIFGLAHFGWGLMGIVQTTFMGFALGVCYVKLNKRLWILILAHAYMDIILLSQMYIG